MDVHSSKKGVGRIMAPKKGYNVALKNTATERDQNAQSCNRIGCNGRIKYAQNMKAGNSEKPKYSKPSFRPSHGNETTVNSSRSSSSVTTSGKRPLFDSKRKLKSNTSESSLSSESELVSSSSSSSPTAYQSESIKGVAVTEIGSSNASSNVRPQEIPHQRSGPSVSGSSTLIPISSNRSRYIVRTVKCNSISDSQTVGKNVVKKRSPEGESSSSGRVRNTSSGISIPGPGQSSSLSADSRVRSMNGNTRTRLQNGRNCSSIREAGGDLSRNLNNERPFRIDSRSYNSLSSYNSDNSSPRMPFTSSEPMFSHLMNRNGIAEVLLALERIDLDGELTHEQILALETSLFLSGLNLYDQHRDMRLDIDNMTYEDLLALEERMGTVSTALPEEALSKCLTKCIYQSTQSEVRVTGLDEDGDDIKCSICQEEYVTGDEIGTLVECQHWYHETCINQWLRLKNWCPICKASAAPSQSSSS